MNKKSVTILGISIWKLFAYFIIYSFIGYIIETLFGIATKGVWNLGKAFYMDHFVGFMELELLLLHYYLDILIKTY